MSGITHSTIKAAKRAKLDRDIPRWADLARMVDCSESYLLKILNNREPGEELRPKIAEALGLTVQDLWPETEPKPGEAA